MMSLGLRNGSTSALDHQAGDPAMDAVARFLQDTSRMLDWLLSTHMPDHSDVRTSLSIGMPSAPHSILSPLLQDAYSHGFPDGRMAPLQTFQYPSYRSGTTYHGDPHHSLQQWFTPRPSGSSMEGVRHLDVAQFRNGMSSSLGKLSERGNQPGMVVNRDALKGFVEDMKRTVQQWSAKHSLLAQGKFVSSDPPVSLAEVPRAVRPPLNSSHPGAHPGVPSFLFSIPAEVGPLSQASAQSGPEMNKNIQPPKGFPEQETPERATTLQRQYTASKNSLDGSLNRVVEDIACQLAGNDVDLPPKETLANTQQPSEKDGANAASGSSATQAEHCEDSVATIDGESHVIFTSSTAKENTGMRATDFRTPSQEEDKLKVALVATTKPTPAARRKKLSARPQLSRRPVEMVGSPDWLPPGWVTEVKIRGSGNSAGSKDKYYVDPITKRRFRSRKEVYGFLESGTVDKSRKAEESPIRKLLGPDAGSPIPDTGPGVTPVAPNEGRGAAPVALNQDPAIQDGQAVVGRAAGPNVGAGLLAASLQLEKSAKRKRGRPPGSRSKPQNAPSSTTAAPDPATVLPSTIAAPSGLLGNVFMPCRNGQPSDWLVYESVATLPFPMFDPFYFSDFNSNKANGNKGPPGRPWFFTGPEASWRPSMGTPPYGASSQSPGSSPKQPSTGRKRASKKSPDVATSAPTNA